MKYKVNEIFYSIQSEGVHTGTPAVFVRLQGCSVGCAWCDTKHTWEYEEKDRRDQKQIISKSGDGSEWCYMYAIDIVLECCRLLGSSKNGHVVITGGEPLEQELYPLVDMLTDTYSVQIETSGTIEIEQSYRSISWITLSPKIGMKKPFLPITLDQCDEIKVPVGKRSDIDFLNGFSNTKNIPIYLQPLSISKKATEICIELCQLNDYKLSIQYHKYIGVR